jgi:very-short-patch-repair endonuclease
VELDGEIHLDEEAIEYDNMRDRSMTNKGIKVLRFSNREVFTEMNNVLKRIGEYLFFVKQRN